MNRRLCRYPLYIVAFFSSLLGACVSPVLISVLLSPGAVAVGATLPSVQRVMVLSAFLHLVRFGEQDNDNEVSMVLANAETTSASSVTESNVCSTTAMVDDVVVVEGISLPPIRVLPDDGKPLYRNGHGIRSIPFFGMNIKVYVAHLYSRRPLSQQNAMALIDSPSSSTKACTSTIGDNSSNDNIDNNNHRHHHHNPLHFDFTFLRHVGQSRVVSAWTQQLEHSVTHRYDGYERDRDRFIQLFSTGHIENGGTQTVQLVGNETRIIDQGSHKGTIVGRDFQKSFLSMWVGPKAVAEDLKRNLFQGHGQTDCGVESEMTRLAREEEPTKVIPVAV
jgi:hypothetical protein